VAQKLSAIGCQQSAGQAKPEIRSAGVMRRAGEGYPMLHATQLPEPFARRVHSVEGLVFDDHTRLSGDGRFLELESGRREQI
jgi:hypothetical protein